MARWTRARRVRWVLAFLVIVVVAGMVAAVLLVQPDLGNARDRVDNTWTPLREPLATWYAALDTVATALHDAGFGERSVTQDLDAALARWNKLALRGAKHTDPEVEATTANELEAQVRRLGANIIASDKLKAVAAPALPLGVAIGAFQQAVVPPPLVKAYNRAVDAYADERSGTINGIVAGLLGYESRPRLLLG